MKKIMIVTITLMALAGLSAATTGTLTLTGTVSGVLDIAVAPAAVSSSLDLTTTQSDLAVATVTEKSNKADGYTVTIDSANAAAAGSNTPSLDGISGVTDSLDYTMKYDGNAVALVSGSAVITDTTDVTDSSGVSKTLEISYTGDPTLTEGSYTDTLTFTIAAK